MLYEYAVDPSLLGDVNNCRTVFDSFRAHNGRLIADVPRQWVRDAFLAIQRIPESECHPVMRKTIKVHLKKLLQQSLCANRPIQDWNRSAETWLRYVATSGAKYPYAGVIADAATEVPIKAYSVKDLFMTAPESWNAPTQIYVARDAVSIVDALMPLLRISKTVMLIDRHIYPGEPRALRVLKEIIARAHQYSYERGIRKVIIHSSDHRQDWQSSLERHVLPILSPGMELEAFLWPKNTEHDRFLVTDVGGISLGEGFDERTRDGTATVLLGLLSTETKRQVVAKFCGEPTYKATITK